MISIISEISCNSWFDLCRLKSKTWFRQVARMKPILKSCLKIVRIIPAHQKKTKISM